MVLPPAKPGHENSRFVFVHFAERSSATKALKNTEKYEIDGSLLFENYFTYNTSFMSIYCQVDFGWLILDLRDRSSFGVLAC